MARKKPTYIALTTHNFQMSGMNILIAAGHDWEKVYDHALAEITRNLVTEIGTDIYADTERKNLIVVSMTEAKRRYGFNWMDHEADLRDPNSRYEWVE